MFLIGAEGGGGRNSSIGGEERIKGMGGCFGKSGYLTEYIEFESVVIKGYVQGEDDPTKGEVVDG